MLQGEMKRIIKIIACFGVLIFICAGKEINIKKAHGEERYSYGGNKIVFVKNVDISDVKKKFAESYISKVKKLIPKYTELKLFPEEERVGVFILEETVSEAADPAGRKWRDV